MAIYQNNSTVAFNRTIQQGNGHLSEQFKMGMSIYQNNPTGAWPFIRTVHSMDMAICYNDLTGAWPFVRTIQSMGICQNNPAGAWSFVRTVQQGHGHLAEQSNRGTVIWQNSPTGKMLFILSFMKSYLHRNVVKICLYILLPLIAFSHE